MHSPLEKALAPIIGERYRQDEKWGQQHHGPDSDGDLHVEFTDVDGRVQRDVFPLNSLLVLS